MALYIKCKGVKVSVTSQTGSLVHQSLPSNLIYLLYISTLHSICGTKMALSCILEILFLNHKMVKMTLERFKHQKGIVVLTSVRTFPDIDNTDAQFSLL